MGGDAEDALDDPRFGKRGLVRKLNELVAITEAFILTAYPGRAALADVCRRGHPARAGD